MTAIWAGIDAGKTHHHCVVIDDTGKRLLSRRVANDETELLQLMADVLALGEVTVWGIDLADGGAALVIEILLNHGQHLLYIPGRSVNRASEGYRGDGKTDAKDAAVIADQARVRRDLMTVRPGDKLVTELKVLTGRLRDLSDDKTRAMLAPVVESCRRLLTGAAPEPLLPDQALARIRLDDPHAAAELLHECIDGASSTGGRVATIRLRRARRELRPWRSENFVADLDDHLIDTLGT